MKITRERESPEGFAPKYKRHKEIILSKLTDTAQIALSLFPHIRDSR